MLSWSNFTEPIGRRNGAMGTEKLASTYHESSAVVLSTCLNPILGSQLRWHIAAMKRTVAKVLHIAGRYRAGNALPFLAAAAKLKSSEASKALNEIATGADDLALARRASKALRDNSGDVPELAAMVRIADNGDEFFERGLGAHLAKLTALAQIKILCRLERAQAIFDHDQWFGIVQRKVNRGAFAPTAEDLEELRRLFAESPKARDLAKRLLALSP